MAAILYLPKSVSPAPESRLSASQTNRLWRATSRRLGSRRGSSTVDSMADVPQGLLRSPKSDIRRIQRARSSHNADFAGLSDFREIALAEIQICPDYGGWVAVGRIEQID